MIKALTLEGGMITMMMMMAKRRANTGAPSSPRKI